VGVKLAVVCGCCIVAVVPLIESTIAWELRVVLTASMFFATAGDAADMTTVSRLPGAPCVLAVTVPAVKAEPDGMSDTFRIAWPPPLIFGWKNIESVPAV